MTPDQDSSTAEMTSGSRRSPEVEPKFMLTPEALQENVEYLVDRNIDEVYTELKSVEGRDRLYAELMKNEGKIKAAYPNFDAGDLRNQLDLMGETLDQKENFLKDSSDASEQPAQASEATVEEKKTAWQKIKEFPKKHPFITTLLVLAAAAGGMYLLWHYLGAAIIIPNTMDGAAAVADEVIAPTGGAFNAIPQGGILGPNVTLPVEGLQPYIPGPVPTPGIFAAPGAVPPMPPPDPSGFFQFGPR